MVRLYNIKAVQNPYISYQSRLCESKTTASIHIVAQVHIKPAPFLSLPPSSTILLSLSTAATYLTIGSRMSLIPYFWNFQVCTRALVANNLYFFPVPGISGPTGKSLARQLVLPLCNTEVCIFCLCPNPEKVFWSCEKASHIYCSSRDIKQPVPERLLSILVLEQRYIRSPHAIISWGHLVGWELNLKLKEFHIGQVKLHK